MESLRRNINTMRRWNGDGDANFEDNELQYLRSSILDTLEGSRLLRMGEFTKDIICYYTLVLLINILFCLLTMLLTMHFMGGIQANETNIQQTNEFIKDLVSKIHKSRT
ncbi:hypothetical protein EB796_000246 [Bugula neritina]|uniref:Uncharacterized protein n=1 Tax=Bugula neritina TaxID=10212 RepID=A0A7J7KTQ7_BUGNE|nr:hypothetical protein EB796_000246 [Bugula neritina]